MSSFPFSKGHSPDSQSSDDLLSTKLSVPSPGFDIIHRERLTNLLDKNQKRLLTLITAPSGYGKTTLLVDWLSRNPYPEGRNIYITLDPMDNEPYIFWSYVITGIRKAYPQFRFNKQLFLQANQDESENKQLIPLINRISAIPCPICLVLDDFHLIQTASIHRNLEYLIDHQPDNLHLFIISRVPPSIRLSRIRSQRQLVEITAEDLAFTPTETHTFMTGIMGLQIDPKQATKIYNTTEGWIAGLQLAALSIQFHEKDLSSLENIPYDHREITNYFTEEVLDHLDDKTRSFILETSILSEFSAQFCDAILDRSDSQTIIDRLERSNLFIQPLDAKRKWFRYHSLFANALEYQITRNDPDFVQQLHQKAVKWLHENNDAKRAIYHAMAANNIEAATEIIDEFALDAIQRNDLEALIYWVSHISNDMLPRRPQLGVISAQAHFLFNQLDQSQADLQNLEKLLNTPDQINISKDEERLIRWEIKTLKTVKNNLSSLPGENILRFCALIAEAPHQDNYVFGFLNNSLAMEYERAENLEGAADIFEKNMDFSHRQKFHTGYVHTACNLARIRMIQGKMAQAEGIFRQTMDYANHYNVHISALADTSTGLMEIASERNNLVLAGQLAAEISQNLDQLDESSIPWGHRVKIMCRLANFYLTSKEFSTGKYYFQNVHSDPGEVYAADPKLLPEYIDTFTRLHLLGKEYAFAEYWLRKRIDHFKGTGFPLLDEKIGLAAIALAQRQTDSSITLLTDLERSAAANGRRKQLIKIKILLAKANWMAENIARASQVLLEALELALPEGYVRSFIDEGQEIEKLLKIIQADPIENKKGEDEYIQRLIAAFEPVSSPVTDTPAGTAPTLVHLDPPVEPLTERELDVIKLLNTGKTVKETAVILAVTPNTARAHLRNIYKKLNVHTLRSALARVKELRLT